MVLQCDPVLISIRLFLICSPSGYSDLSLRNPSDGWQLVPLCVPTPLMGQVCRRPFWCTKMLSSRNVIDVSTATWGLEPRIMLGEGDRKAVWGHERKAKGRKNQGDETSSEQFKSNSQYQKGQWVDVALGVRPEVNEQRTMGSWPESTLSIPIIFVI